MRVDRRANLSRVTALSGTLTRRGVTQTCSNVIQLRVGEIRQNLCVRNAIRKHSHNVADTNSHATNTRSSAALEGLKVIPSRSRVFTL